jgi:glycosyltransferase involved in cell wall biosynthesis
MTNNDSLFSVLIANYNRGSYINECIKSVISQTYPNIEIVIVDDGSTDNSREIIQLLAATDNRIRFHFSAQNEGCGSAMRKCAELCTGRWFGFVGSDDVLLPEAVEIMVAGHLSNADCSIVCSSHYVCDENLTIERLAYGAEKIPPNESYLSYGKGITSFSSFSRDFYRMTEGINEKFKRAVDQDIYYKMEEVGEVHFISTPTYLYRVNAQGISTKKNLSKSRYWFVRAKENAFLRRHAKPTVKSIDQQELDAWWSILYITKSSEAFQQWKFCKGFYWLIHSARKSFVDKHTMLKVRTLFMNSFFHKVYLRFR